ncbi:STAS domain-containing protein [Mycobacterium adipatum]
MLPHPPPRWGAALAAGPGGAPAAIVVDLVAVDFLASSGMGVLVAAHIDLAPSVRVAIVADGPAIGRHLKLIGIADMVSVFAELGEALAALRD